MQRDLCEKGSIIVSTCMFVKRILFKFFKYYNILPTCEFILNVFIRSLIALSPASNLNLNLIDFSVLSDYYRFPSN